MWRISPQINWMKPFLCFNDSGKQRGKSLTCMWSLNRTLISVPNTLLFFVCFCIYLLFFLLFLKRKTHLGSSGELSPALRSGEDLFCCPWQSIQIFLFIFLVFSPVLLIILFYRCFFSCFVYVSSSLYEDFFFFLNCGSITFLWRKKDPFCTI